MEEISITVQLEHYKLMREEISQNTSEAFKALELGITIISALFALACAKDFILPEMQWFFFLFPSIMVAPLIMLMAQRFRQTRKIGTYLGIKVEPKLGIVWENNQQASVKQEKLVISKKNKRMTPRSLSAMSLPLMIVQIISLPVSLSNLTLSVNPVAWYVWLIWSLMAVFIGCLTVIEWNVMQEALNKDFSRDV